jgi:outer membrane protein TolC
MGRPTRSFRGPFAGALLAVLLTAVVPAAADVLRLETLLAEEPASAPGQLTAEAARVAAASARVELAESAYYPQVALGAEASLSPGGRLVRVEDAIGTSYLVPGTQTVDESGAFVPEARYGLVLSARQQLYDFGRTAAGVRVAEAQVRAAQASEVTHRVMWQGALRGAYLRWLGAWLEVEAVRIEVADAVARRAAVEARVSEGLRGAADLRALEVHEARLALQATRSGGELSAARRGLERVRRAPLPEGASPDITLLERSAPSPASAARAPAPGDAVAAALEAQAEALRAGVRAAELGRAPTLMVTGEAGLSGQGAQVFPMYRAVVSLTVPLLDGGATAARSDAARAVAAELAAEGREHRIALAADRSAADGELSAALATLAAAERLRAAAEGAAKDAADRYALGQGAVESVLEARATLAEAEHQVLLAKLVRSEAWLARESASPR